MFLLKIKFVFLFVQVLYSEQVRGFPGRRVLTLRCELFGLAGHYSLVLRPTTPTPSIPHTAAYVKVKKVPLFMHRVQNSVSAFRLIGVTNLCSTCTRAAFSPAKRTPASRSSSNILPAYYPRVIECGCTPAFEITSPRLHLQPAWSMWSNNVSPVVSIVSTSIVTSSVSDLWSTALFTSVKRSQAPWLMCAWIVYRRCQSQVRNK